MANRKTTKQFIMEATAVHGGLYSYDKVQYKNNSTKVTITCPEHGDFDQDPKSHLKGSGCSVCFYLKKTYTTEQFIQKAREKHGDKYVYDKVEHKHNKTKVTITCPKHGDFQQKPNSHLNGNGCPYCAGRKKTTEQFVIDSREIHGDLYIYDKVEYKNSETKVTITCSDHGDFEQLPNNHLTGSGCPKCWSYTGRTRLYLVELDSHGESLLKVGVTNFTVEQRYNNSLYPDQNVIREIAYTDFEHRDDAEVIEKNILDLYKEYKHTPKVSFRGHTECLSWDVLEDLKKEFEKV